MNTKSILAIVSIALVFGMIGTSIVSLSTASAASDQACQNQIERHDRFLVRDWFGSNPNDDNGAARSHDNSHKTLDNTCY